MPQTVGNGTDFSAEVTSPLINAATGSFPSVTGVTSEDDGGVANKYALQLNTKPFTSPVCTGHPGCQGWQQFIYSNSGAAFIQYWLLNYSTACPGGWNTYGSDCWENGPNSVAVTTQPITNLASLSLTGTATSGGTDDVHMTAGGTTWSASNQDDILSLASDWRGAEFIVVGDCCLSQADFNAGSTIVVRTTVHNGTMNAPSCVFEGFTGETNNLTLVGAPVFTTGPSPAIESQQSNVPGSAASCASAAGIGDTHLRTFGGLLYDFQATGDFLLSQAKGFTVQARQVSGAPTWPNAAVNHAIATQMGADRVALCAAPTRLVVDGKAAGLADGQTLSLPTGVNVFRTGNVYLVTDQDGNSVRAVMNPTWIDASVGLGLGTSPTNVVGLLANANGNVNQLETSDGTVLTEPIPFETLYQRLGQSWRVAPAASLLSDCGRVAEQGNPTQPFLATNLPPDVRDSGRAACARAGVTDSSLLDACTLDVAVLGSQAAAAYIGAPPPVANGNP